MIWLICLVMALIVTLYLAAPMMRTDRAGGVIIATMLLCGPLALYAAIGAPALPGASYASRWQNPVFALATGDAALSEDRPLDAVVAYQRAIADGDAGAGIYARLGEAIVAAHDGQVTAEAAEAFARALMRDPKEPRARFFGGLLLMQRGDTAGAVQVWKTLAHELDARSSLQPLLREVLSRAAAPAGK